MNETPIRYGLACERTERRTLALCAVIAAAKAHEAARRLDTLLGGDDLALSKASQATRGAVDEAARRAASCLPSGEVGGILLGQALAGDVPGLESS